MKHKTLATILMFISLILISVFIYGWGEDKYQTGYAVGIWLFSGIVFISGLIMYYEGNNN